MISFYFFTGLYLVSMRENFVHCLLPYSMLTISKPLNFSTMQLETFFSSFPPFRCLFSLQLNTFKKYPCSIRALFISKHCSSNLLWSNFSWAFPLNLAIFCTILSLSHLENHYIDLLFLFFFHDELHDKLHKKMNLQNQRREELPNLF